MTSSSENLKALTGHKIPYQRVETPELSTTKKETSILHNSSRLVVASRGRMAAWEDTDQVERIYRNLLFLGPFFAAK